MIEEQQVFGGGLGHAPETKAVAPPEPESAEKSAATRKEEAATPDVTEDDGA